MKPGIESLQDPSKYERLDLWEHSQLVPYVQQYLRKRTAVSMGYIALSLLSVFVLGFAWIGSGKGFGEGLGQVGLGIALGYVLIIPHEHIHGLVYRILGANNVRIRYNIRQFTALCIADREVLNGHELALVAIAPFAFLTVLLLITLFVADYPLVFLAALALHTAACSGDAAIINYVWLHRRHPLYTYDDDNLQQTYFFKPRDAELSV